MDEERVESVEQRDRDPKGPAFGQILRALMIALPILIAIARGPLKPLAITQHASGACGALLAVLLLMELASRAHSHRSRRRLLDDLGAARLTAFGALVAITILTFALNASGMLLAITAFTVLTVRQTRARWDRNENGATRPGRLTLHEHGQKSELRLRLSARAAERIGRARTSTLGSTVGLTRLASTVALALIACGTIWASTPKAIRIVQDGFTGASSKTVGESNDNGNGRTTATTTGSAPTPTVPNPTPTTTPIRTPTATEWDGKCESLPAETVAVALDAQIQELYTGEAIIHGKRNNEYPLPSLTGPPPGHKQAGCIAKFHETTSHPGFVYAYGENPRNGRILSIAADSSEYGPCLFLAPAVEKITKIIETTGILGGSRRHDVGHGDLYAVTTPLGTYLLIRSEKDSEYELLSPAESQRWAQAIRSSGRFLWPVPRRGGGYALYTNTTPRTFWSNVAAAPEAEPAAQLSEDEVTKDTEKAHTE
jgi:hypothetical protein